MPTSFVKYSHNTLTNIVIWLRITLSYCVLGGLVVSLISAYLQQVNSLVITLIMASTLSIGVYFAEITRRNIGLNKYQRQLLKQKHLNY